MLKTITPEQVLLLMCKTTSQTPMTDGEIASLLDTKRNHVNEVLDQLYEGKAINQANVTKNGVAARQVWVTGFAYRRAPVQSKVIPPPRRNEQASSYTPPNDMLWQHLRVEPIKEPTMTTTQPKAIVTPSNLNEKGIKNPQKIVRFLFANTQATSNQIRQACDVQHVDPFIKPYVRKGYVDRVVNPESKLAVYSITAKGRLLGSADALYNCAKIKQPSKMMHEETKAKTNFVHIPAVEKPVSESPTRVKPVDDDLTAEQKEEYAAAVKELPADFFDDAFPADKTAIEFKLETKHADPVRFALTSDGTLMIIGVHYLPIELSKEDTKRLYDFAENTVHAI